jgi:phenylalanyl-tRNA synthetase beta chain
MEPAEFPPLASGHALALRAGGQTFGWAGTLDPSVLEQLGLRGRVHLAEFALSGIAAAVVIPRFKPLSKFPAMVRDFSFLTPAEVTWARLRTVLVALPLTHLTSVELVEVYEGRGLPSGTRSWTFSMAFRAADRTLEDGDVKDVPAMVERTLRESLGASQRAGETHAV